MVIGITMVKVVPGQEKAISCSLKGREGIMDIYHIFGEYDFFVILQAEGLNRLNLLLADLQNAHDVIAARTVLVGYDDQMQHLNPVKALAC